MNEQENKQTETSGAELNSDENQAGTNHLNEPVADESELEKLKAELAEANDKLLRKVAEMDNMRRRHSTERLDLIKSAGKDLITELLEVLDDCDRAQQQLEKSEDIASLREGVSLVFNKFRNKLQSKGLKAMETLHQEFNPDLHEALTEVPVPDESLKGKVVDEVAKGYTLNEKIIRHAKVVVGK